ncbi:MAG: hypothetical protein JNL26_13320 [Gemmatimonadetes bacterium]|nr:hypothetical protein [Gemmatimonadota bacterium]
MTPASSDFQVTMLPLYTTFGFHGSTFTSAKSDPRLCTRSSLLVFAHVAPASSER